MDVSTKTLSVFKDNSNEREFLTNVSFRGAHILLDLLNEHKISINQSCGGHGSCTTCRVIIQDQQVKLAARTEIEVERAEERRFKNNERLACQLEIDEDLEIIIP